MDAAFVAQHCGEQLRGLAVRFEQLSAMLQKLACARCVAANSADPIRGRWATGTPDARVNPRVPSFSGDPDGYAAMCQYFGVPADGLFRPHWPTIRELVNQRLAAGEPLPKFLRGETVEYVLRMRATGALE